MKKLSMAFIIGLCIAGVMAAQEITGERGDYKLKYDKTFDVQAGGTLRISGVNGDIKVSAGRADKVTIFEEMDLDVYTRNEAEEVLDHVRHAYRQDGNVVTIDGDNIRHADNRLFTVTVPDKFNLELATSGGDLEINGIGGNVKLHTLGGDVMAKDITGVVEVNTAGGDLVFTSISGQLHANTSGGDISMKEMLGECTVSTQGGDIEVRHATSRLSLSSSGGDLSLNQIEGPFDAKTMGGDIELIKFTGPQGSLATMGGEINLSDCSGVLRINSQGGDIQGKDLRGQVDVSTMGGEIQIDDLQAGATVATMGGDVRINLTLKDFKKPHALRIESKGGDVELSVPAGLPATVLAEIQLSRKDWASKRYDIYSDFPLSKETSDETDQRVLRSKGEINGGGDPIEIRTVGGDIYIKKSQ